MPTKEEVYLPRLGQQPLPLVESFERVLTKRGIDSLNLTPELRAHAGDAQPLFYEVDGHPNAEGYQLIARVVADHLQEFGSSYGLPEQLGGTNQAESAGGSRHTF